MCVLRNRLEGSGRRRAFVLSFAIILLSTVPRDCRGRIQGHAYSLPNPVSSKDSHFGFLFRTFAISAHRHCSGDALPLRSQRMAPQHRARGAGANQRLAGTDPPALPVQQHEHDRVADSRATRARPKRRSKTCRTCMRANLSGSRDRTTLKEELEVAQSTSASKSCVSASAKGSLGHRPAADARADPEPDDPAPARERDLSRHRAVAGRWRSRQSGASVTAGCSKS